MAKTKRPQNAGNVTVEENVARREVQQSQVQVAAAFHCGPIPDPATLHGYEQICPGAAERIIAMAEQQATHRQALEAVVVKSRARDSLLGVIFGFLIAVGTIAGGVYVIMHGHDLAGGVVSLSGLAGLVSVFVYGTSQNRKEREQKMQSTN